MFLMKQRILRSAAVDLSLSGRLYLHEPVILPLLCKKFGGRTALNYLALIHNYNLVCARRVDRRCAIISVVRPAISLSIAS